MWVETKKSPRLDAKAGQERNREPWSLERGPGLADEKPGLCDTLKRAGRKPNDAEKSRQREDLSANLARQSSLETSM